MRTILHQRLVGTNKHFIIRPLDHEAILSDDHNARRWPWLEMNAEDRSKVDRNQPYLILVQRWSASSDHTLKSHKPMTNSPKNFQQFQNICTIRYAQMSYSQQCHYRKYERGFTPESKRSNPLLQLKFFRIIIFITEHRICCTVFWPTYARNNYF